jgi:uncharacterized protein
MPDNLTVLMLPGWQNSGPGHWQTLWEEQHGFLRVDQDDWLRPLRGDWMARLEDSVLAQPGPVLLAAHSLGCHLVAAWAAHSANARRVTGGLLVAPPDTERTDTPPQLSSWRPMVRQRLPFGAHVVSSSDDLFCTPERARGLAADWGAGLTSLGRVGHINAASGLGDWPEGLHLLRALQG